METPTVPKSTILAILQDRPIAYHPILAKALGGVKQAVFVSQLLYWTGKGKRADGFIWKTQEEWTEETGLSAYEQRTARKHLVKSGVLQEKLKSVPARLYYRLNTDVLQTRIEEYHEQVMENLHNKSDTTLTAIPEITPEITTQKEEPATPDSPGDDSLHIPLSRLPPPDDSEETAALFKEPKPTTGTKMSAAEFKENHAHTIEGLQQETVKARASVAHPDMGDPTKDTDPWANGPLSAFCAVAHLDPKHVKPSEKRDWPRQLKKWAESWSNVDGDGVVTSEEICHAATPSETVQCLRGITQSEHAWKTFTSPRQTSFQETMDVMLSRLRGGQPWNAEGKRNGGPSTGRQPVVDQSVADTMARLFDENGVRINRG